MITSESTLNPTRRSISNIVGPYSPWPRQKPRNLKRPAIAGSFALLVGVFLHCGLPLVT